MTSSINESVIWNLVRELCSMFLLFLSKVEHDNSHDNDIAPDIYAISSQGQIGSNARKVSSYLKQLDSYISSVGEWHHIMFHVWSTLIIGGVCYGWFIALSCSARRKMIVQLWIMLLQIFHLILYMPFNHWSGLDMIIKMSAWWIASNNEPKIRHLIPNYLRFIVTR